jgi:hypothetical protein
LNLRERAEWIDRVTIVRLEQLAPRIMREEGIDTWVLVAREYNEDPRQTRSWSRARHGLAEAPWSGGRAVAVGIQLADLERCVAGVHELERVQQRAHVADRSKVVGDRVDQDLRSTGRDVDSDWCALTVSSGGRRAGIGLFLGTGSEAEQEWQDVLAGRHGMRAI